MYNNFIPFDLKDPFLQAHIVTDLTAADLILIVNALHDIHDETRKPFFMRFWNYRKRIREIIPLHEELHDMLVKKISTMKELCDLRDDYDKTGEE